MHFLALGSISNYVGKVKTLSEYYSFCLQVNLPRAIKVLKQLKNPTRREAKFRSQVFNRFVRKTERLRVPVKDPLVREIIKAYRDYYRASLLNPKKAESFERVLLASLNAICFRYGIGSKRMKFDDVEEALRQELKKRKIHALFGTVCPFKSLLLWRRERKKGFTIQLLENKEVVKVVFLEGFIELGWLHYATFGRHYVGGWAKEDALYCVAQAYKLGSDRFNASYLHHEAQHFSDYEKFPNLLPQDLEYRAKLAELIASKRPAKLLSKFAKEARDNKMLPHSYAAFRLMENFDQQNLNALKIRRTASELLSAHSSLLVKKGSRTIRTALLST